MYSKHLSKENISEIWSFMLPLIVEQSAISLMSVVRSGFMSNISPAAVSGVSLIDGLNVIIQQIFLSLVIGVTVVVSQYRGRGDAEAAANAVEQSMLSTVGLSLVLMVLMLVIPHPIVGMVLGRAEPAVYNSGFIFFICVAVSFPFLAIGQNAGAVIRGCGQPRAALMLTILTNGLFAVFGYILIFPMNLGVWGSGIALILSRVAGAAAGIVMLRRGTGFLKIKRIFPRRLDMAVQRPILRVGIPACIESTIFNGGRLVTQTFTVAMGTSNMAANAIASSLAGFFNIPDQAASATIMPLVGKYKGMGDKKKAKHITIAVMALGIILSAALAVLMWVFQPTICSIFTDDPVIAKLVNHLSITYYIIGTVLWVFAFVLPSALRAAGDANYTTVSSVASMIVFRISTGYLFARVLGWGVMGIWTAMYIDWIVRTLLFGWRFLNGKWLSKEII